MLYYSEKLKKTFPTVEELEKAEKEEEDRLTALSNKAKEKPARAKEVEEAFANYVKTKKKAFAEIDEAYEKWVELRDNFVKDYGQFHMTYSNVDGKERYNLSNGFNSIEELLEYYLS